MNVSIPEKRVYSVLDTATVLWAESSEKEVFKWREALRSAPRLITRRRTFAIDAVQRYGLMLVVDRIAEKGEIRDQHWAARARQKLVEMETTDPVPRLDL